MYFLKQEYSLILSQYDYQKEFNIDTVLFCQPLAFTFFLDYPGKQKCEILPSAELSKGPCGLIGDVCGICLSVELPQGSGDKAAVMR